NAGQSPDRCARGASLLRCRPHGRSARERREGVLMAAEQGIAHPTVAAPETTGVYVEGLRARLAGAVTIAGWMFVLDAIRGRPLYTPTVLAGLGVLMGTMVAEGLMAVVWWRRQPRRVIGRWRAARRGACRGRGEPLESGVMPTRGIVLTLLVLLATPLHAGKGASDFTE